MQAIQTKYIPATNHKGSRIKAWCYRGQITIGYPCELGDENNFKAAADALRQRFAKNDARVYGTPIDKNPWLRPMVGGGLPGGGYAFVFIEA